MKKVGTFTYIVRVKSASDGGNLISKPTNRRRVASFRFVALEKNVLQVP